MEAEQIPALIQEFLQDLQLRRHITPRTREAYLYDLRIFYTFLTARRVLPAPDPSPGPPAAWQHVTIDHLRRVDYPLLRDFLLQFESPISSRHQQRKAAVLRSFFRYLTDIRELLDRNPSVKIHVGFDRQQTRDEARQIKSLDRRQLQLFLENVRTGACLPSDRARQYHQRTRQRDWAIAVLFVTTGLRLSELAAISLGDLDLARGHVRVRRKGGFLDWVPLQPDARQAIQAYITGGERPEPAGRPPTAEAPLFVATTTRRRLTPRQIENLIKRYAVTADPRLQFVSPHKLRHTFAQQIYEATGDLYLTAVSLAHQSVESARIYAKVREEQRQWAVGRLSVAAMTGYDEGSPR
ncbi:MAG TPA: tyrosine-type recombinase/integrase [Symbiobacteriaceae bacterium]|nr:tyrosine-type recombinase/integrase [Symbiobacteriaceae bacterium]